MFKLLLLASYLTFLLALSKNEIEDVRRELNKELNRLEKKNVVSYSDASLDKILGLTKEKQLDKKRDELSSFLMQDDKKEASLKEILLKAKTSNENKRDDIFKTLMLNDKRQVFPLVCEDQKEQCREYVDYCYDKEYIVAMAKMCPQTCNKCPPTKDCKDVANHCHLIESYCSTDKYRETMKKNCYKSCKYCKELSPCHSDPLGCCWDHVTFVRDGCPRCEDQSNLAAICKNFKQDCVSKYGPGKYMRKNCPVACGICDPEKECYDRPGFHSRCKVWKEKGQCDEYDVINDCPVTCNACDKRDLFSNA